jgi:hypothetical protein
MALKQNLFFHVLLRKEGVEEKGRRKVRRRTRIKKEE